MKHGHFVYQSVCCVENRVESWSWKYKKILKSDCTINSPKVGIHGDHHKKWLDNFITNSLFSHLLPFKSNSLTQKPPSQTPSDWIGAFKGLNMCAQVDSCSASPLRLTLVRERQNLGSKHLEISFEKVRCSFFSSSVFWYRRSNTCTRVWCKVERAYLNLQANA